MQTSTVGPSGIIEYSFSPFCEMISRRADSSNHPVAGWRAVSVFALAHSPLRRTWQPGIRSPLVQSANRERTNRDARKSLSAATSGGHRY